MLVVVAKHKNNTVDVIDTDDMVVENIGVVEASHLGLDIIGLGWSDGLKFSMTCSDFSMYTRVYFKSCDKAKRINNIKVLCKYDRFDFPVFGVFGDSCEFFYDSAEYSNLMNLLLRVYIAGYLFAHEEDFRVNIDICLSSVKFDFSKYRVDILLKYLLYGIYSGDNCIVSIMEMKSGVEFIPNINSIRAGLFVFEHKGSVYFCTDDCIISVEKDSMEESVKRIKDYCVFTAKQLMINNNSIPIDVVTGDLIVEDCRFLTINSNRVYKFPRKIYVDQLKLAPCNAKFRFRQDSMIIVSVSLLISSQDKDIVNNLLSHVTLDYVHYYDMPDFAFTQDFLSKIVKRYKDLSSNVNAIDNIHINNISTQDEVVAFYRRLLTDKGVARFKDGSYLSVRDFDILKVLQKIDNLKMLPEDIKYNE